MKRCSEASERDSDQKQEECERLEEKIQITDDGKE